MLNKYWGEQLTMAAQERKNYRELNNRVNNNSN